ncbi:MAG TPA: hypothetical protein VF952_00745 [Chloroflexia bacterium]|jgi:hypothetical protein
MRNLRIIENMNGVDSALVPMCFTPHALRNMLESVGSRLPESGAKAFSPKDKLGIEVVEFDANGSSFSNDGVYTPDAEWGTARIKHWLDAAEGGMKLWSGDIHSHPPGCPWPSRKSGRGMGDLGYVEEVFGANDWMECFLMPILVGTGTGKAVDLYPWVVTRSHPKRPMLAQVKVCSIEDFPDRPFNPIWLNSLEQERRTGKLPDYAEGISMSSLASRVQDTSSGNQLLLMGLAALVLGIAAWRRGISNILSNHDSAGHIRQ